MAAKRAAIPAKHLFNGFRPSPNQPSLCLTRSMATETSLPQATVARAHVDASVSSASTEPLLRDAASISSAPSKVAIHIPQPFQAQPNPFLGSIQCTLHHFPSFEPIRFIKYPSTHLGVPLRKDILHRAVIFEGDNTRQGTASTKWRDEVHGSGKKIRPQKGSGHARLGDKKSPMLRGGGVAFGPKPRDFGTDLPIKVYDLAWRMALSYRYAKGELLVIDSAKDFTIPATGGEQYLKDLFAFNNLGRGFGRTLFVLDQPHEGLFDALKSMPKDGRASEVDDVDVKDLLGMGRLVVEQSALRRLLQEHQSDLYPRKCHPKQQRLLMQ